MGFFGVWVNTRVQTPRRCGDPLSAGVFDFSRLLVRPLRTSCWIVGKLVPLIARQSNDVHVEGQRRPATGDCTKPTDQDSGSKRPGKASSVTGVGEAQATADGVAREPLSRCSIPDLDDPADAIETGRVLVGGKPMLNPRARVAESAPITVRPELVLRGAAKLEAAITGFDVARRRADRARLRRRGRRLHDRAPRPRRGPRLRRRRRLRAAPGRAAPEPAGGEPRTHEPRRPHRPSSCPT